MASLDDKIKEWLEWDRNSSTRSLIEELVKNDNKQELEKILMDRISFGTAGLRGRMSAGYSCMNDLVIVQTGQGFLMHLAATDPARLLKKGIVIGYDGRHNSRRWAEITAAIFAQADIPVHLFSKVCPTPFVPFTVSLLQASAGVMITASHNPKDDNGYKVYGWNGCQIVSPVDKQIQESILKHLEPLETSWNIDVVKNHPKISDPLEKAFDRYLEVIKDTLIQEHVNLNCKTKLKFTYTPMHGVGYEYIARVFAQANLSVIPVEEQKLPDPDFPTVKFPNPEEGKSALNLAIATADANGSNIIIANDPDADRLAVAEKKDGKWKIFTGNELGGLLAFWAWHCHQTKHPNDPHDSVYMLASTVSSKLVRTMARAECFKFIETLTGFKWLGNKTYELMHQDKTVIFAFEEAIGFMMGTAVLDKDGVSAAIHCATLACYLYHHGLTLQEQLEEIYKEYGLHISKNFYYICHEPEVIKKMFERIRNFDGPNTYPNSICNGKYHVKSVRDLTTGYDSSQPENKAILPVSKSTQMITFEFKNGLVCTLRTSGTEPKIKQYSEISGQPNNMDRTELEGTLNEMVSGIVREFFEPEKNNLTPQSD